MQGTTLAISSLHSFSHLISAVFRMLEVGVCIYIHSRWLLNPLLVIFFSMVTVKCCLLKEFLDEVTKVQSHMSSWTVKQHGTI